MQWDNSTEISSANLFFNSTTSDGYDITIFLAQLQAPFRLYIQDANDATNFQLWQINGAITNPSAGVYQVPVQFISSGGTGTTNFPDNHALFVALNRQGFSGFSGYSGFSGKSGYSGYSGSGISGYSGFSAASPGASGYSGFCGLSGYSGFCGLSGYSGYCGLSGYSGFCGLSGYSGFSAASPGASGYSGFCGTAGSEGTSGFSGYSGISGWSGYSGYSGLGIAWTELFVITNDFTTSSTSLVDITGLVSGTLSNNTLYEIEAVLKGNGADTNGVKFGVHGGGTGGAATCQVNALVGSQAIQITTIDTVSTAQWTNSTEQTAFFKGWVTTRGTGTATLSLQIAKVTSGTATVRKGSTLRFKAATIA